MGGVDGVGGRTSSPWENYYEKPLPRDAEKAAASAANVPWLTEPPDASSPSPYPAAIFSNPAMFGKPVVLAAPRAPPAPKPETLRAAPNALRGVTVATLAENVPRGTRTDATRAFTCGAGYKLYPEVSKQPDGKDAVVYWNAFNTQTKRVELLVGPDALKTFTSAPSDYATAAANAFMGGQDAVTIESAKTVDVAMHQGLGPAAAKQLWKSQVTAWTDPAWVAKTTANVVSAVGPATAARAELRLQARTAAAEVQAARPSATAFLTHVNEDLPLGQTTGSRTMNCANCVIATDASIAGSPASALPGKVTHPSVLSDHYNKQWSPVVRAPADIEAVMRHAGPGSRGVVLGARPVGSVGHFFNVVNDGGTIRFLDGQGGEVAQLGEFNRFWVLRTN